MKKKILICKLKFLHTLTRIPQANIGLYFYIQYIYIYIYKLSLHYANANREI